MIANTWQFMLSAIAQWAAEKVPQWALRWQNRVLFESTLPRAVRALVVMTLTMMSLQLVVHGFDALVPMQLPSAKWQQHQESTQRLSQQLNLQQTQFAVAQTQLISNNVLL